MQFGFSEEQEELRRTVRAFFEQKSPETEVRRLMETEPGYDTAVWQQMAEQLGLQGLAIPEDLGGSGYSHRELGIVLEEMGRALVCAPFLASAVLATSTLLESGDEAAQKELVPALAAGEAIATVAYVEDARQSEPSAITTRADASADGYVVTGVKSFVVDGIVADLILVTALTDAGVGLFAVAGAAPGVTRSSLSTMDQTRKLARVELENAPARLVGDDGAGARIVERALRLTCIGLAHEALGGAQRCLELSVAYAKERVQFGRPIGSFQAVKHKCADMLVQVELAKSAAHYAAWCASVGDDDLPIAAAMAKSYCSEAYFNVAAETIQVHGGIGFTWEHPAHLYFKRAKSSELLFGDPLQHRRALAAHLGI